MIVIPKSKAANDDNTKSNPIFATPEEKSPMNDINKLKKTINDNSIQRENVQSINKNVILSSIKKLKNCGMIRNDIMDLIARSKNEVVVCKFQYPPSNGGGCKVADLKCLFATCCDLMIAHYIYCCKNTS